MTEPEQQPETTAITAGRNSGGTALAPHRGAATPRARDGRRRHPTVRPRRACRWNTR